MAVLPRICTNFGVLCKVSSMRMGTEHRYVYVYITVLLGEKKERKKFQSISLLPSSSS
jgi:hypothetical protein